MTSSSDESSEAEEDTAPKSSSSPSVSQCGSLFSPSSLDVSPLITPSYLSESFEGFPRSISYPNAFQVIENLTTVLDPLGCLDIPDWEEDLFLLRAALLRFSNGLPDEMEQYLQCSGSRDFTVARHHSWSSPSSSQNQLANFSFCKPGGLMSLNRSPSFDKMIRSFRVLVLGGVLLMMYGIKVLSLVRSICTIFLHLCSLWEGRPPY